MDLHKSGGGAIDSAVGATLIIGAVDRYNSVGGGCFVLIRRSDGKVFTINCRVTAPRLVSRDYIRNG